MPTISLPYERVDSYINEISLGGRFVFIQNENGADVPIFVSHCSGKERLLANFVEEQAYKKAVADGFLTIEEMSIVLRDRGIFTTEDEQEIDGLQKKIEAQQAVLEKTTKVRARQDRVIEIINNLKSRLIKVISKREKNLEFCAERKAQEERIYFLTWKCTKRTDCETLFWPTKSNFDNETDLDLRKHAFIEYAKLSAGIDVSLIRYIARSNLWRIRYTTAMKTGESLFDRPIVDYSTDQMALVYWSHYYQSISEMLPDERPADSILENDMALDAYMNEYFAKQNREAVASKEKKTHGVKSAWDHGETLVFSSNPVYQDVEYSDTIEAARNKQGIDYKVKSPKSKR